MAVFLDVLFTCHLGTKNQVKSLKSKFNKNCVVIACAIHICIYFVHKINIVWIFPCSHIRSVVKQVNNCVGLGRYGQDKSVNCLSDRLTLTQSSRTPRRYVCASHILPPACVVWWEGNVLTCVCPSIHPWFCLSTGGVRSSQWGRVRSSRGGSGPASEELCGGMFVHHIFLDLLLISSIIM